MVSLCWLSGFLVVFDLALRGLVGFDCVGLVGLLLAA